MTYVIEVWNDYRSRKILKGFDKKKPVFVSRAEWQRGAPVQECGTEWEAKHWLRKIDAYEKQTWRGRAIVEVH